MDLLFLFLPFTLSEIISSIFQNHINSNSILAALILIEILLVLLNINPKFINFKINKIANSVIFYLFINIATNLALIIWFGIGIGL